MNKIQNVLNDEESMKQIKELADMLTADNGRTGRTGRSERSSTKPPEHGLFSASPKPGGVSPPAESKPGASGTDRWS